MYQPYALDYLKRELIETGRRVDIGVVSLSCPKRYLYEKTAPRWQFWSDDSRILAVEEKWNPHSFRYDPSDRGLAELVRRAKTIFRVEAESDPSLSQRVF